MLLDTPVHRKRRPNYSPEFRKQLAQSASEPGVSVSRLAQENDINVNMLFKWRRELREGRLDGVMHRQAMLPVTIVDESPDNLPLANSIDLPDAAAGQEPAVTRPSVIEIQMAGAVMRFDGKADLSMVRAVLGMLRT
ncbi:IS66-like element accessory protein TnpA [Undibacterium sp. Di26W]|uniref:IS66-like element accessory protein TnpA n=1 Tax=Undibacterium sp. Di26W TaxID=3413035 RepID=UPI003BF3EAB0